MKILLTGRDGQVGWELERMLAPLGEIVATGRAQLDLADPDAIRRVVREAKPQVIVNAAAYTAVDKAESEPDLAMRINGDAPGVLAEEAKRLGGLLVHYSTDYVFDGEKGAPYTEDDQPNPINVYGASKLKGERAIQAVGPQHLILRTSWVYATRGNNFLLTMLRMAREGKPLRVVNDQIGAPTPAHALASATAALVPNRDQSGIFHMTSGGVASWYEFAVEIMETAGLAAKVIPIMTAEYPRPARRPRDSRLDNSKLSAQLGLALPGWQAGLRNVWAAGDAGAPLARR